MRDRNVKDNLYEEGTLITAKENPALVLVIKKYVQRIYYCEIAGQPGLQQLAYFERNLIPPSQDKTMVMTKQTI